MTKAPKAPKDRFWIAVADPDPMSMAIAQDIALENGWKIWNLAEERSDAIHSYFGHPTKAINTSYGSLWYTSPLGYENGVEWKIKQNDTYKHSGRKRSHPSYDIVMFFEYQDLNEILQWEWESAGIYDTVEQAMQAAARYAWYSLKVMKQGGLDGDNRTGSHRIQGVIRDRQPDSLPAELNPAREDPRRAFDLAVADPSPGSIEIAQDIALENGWKLWELGEQYAELVHDRWWRENKAVATTHSVGAFMFGDRSGVAWMVSSALVGGETRYRVLMRYQYAGQEITHRLGAPWPGQHPRSTGPVYRTPLTFRSYVDARERAAEDAWVAFDVMKINESIGIPFDQTLNMIGRQTDEPQNRVPEELIRTKRNSAMKTKNPDDLDAARAKYEEFHRYAPKKVGEFPSSFEIPKRLLCAGKAKWVTYRSGKVDPSTLKKPRGTVDYIHEHDAGVMTYIKDAEPDTTVPEKYRDVGALVKLGECLGFCVVGDDGEEIEAEATTPLPELYSTPDGKCLFVIQGKKDVLAATWGGALGVFARGIDG